MFSICGQNVISCGRIRGIHFHQAMQNCQSAGRSNLVLGLVRCTGLPDNVKSRPSRLPLDRMPTGYIEQKINFFNASHSKTVATETMFTIISKIFVDPTLPQGLSDAGCHNVPPIRWALLTPGTWMGM